MPPHSSYSKSFLSVAWVKEGDRYFLRGNRNVCHVYDRRDGRMRFMVGQYQPGSDAAYLARLDVDNRLRLSCVTYPEVEAMFDSMPVDEFVAALEVVYLQASGDGP